MRATSRRSAPSSPSRSVSPRRDLGGQGPASTCRGPPPPDLLLRLDDLAALGLAVGRRRLGVPLTLAGVDAVADHLVTAGLLLGPGADGTGTASRPHWQWWGRSSRSVGARRPCPRPWSGGGSLAADLDPLAVPERAVELEPEATEHARDGALEHSARLSGALLLQVLRVAQPLRLREVLRRETERAWPVTLAVVTGIPGAVGNIVFREAIIGCKWLFRDQTERLGGGIPLALVAGGLVLLLLDRLFPGEVLGYGFPRFLEMLHLQGARVKRRWMVVKTLGSAVSLGAGAAVGREGPIAQIGGSIGGAVAQLARLSSAQREILSACGAAAGIATTFNAPLGALMFAHEIVLLGEVRLVNFTLILIATTTAVVVSRGLFGSLPVFVVPAFSLESYWECFTYAALGVVLGLLAAAYPRLFHAVAGYLRRLALPRAAVLLAGLALVGVLDVAVPGNISDGYGVVNDALAGRLPASRMAVLALAKIAGSTLSLGCGAPGGVFGPIFFIGAMTGGSFRALSTVLLPELTGPRGSYALVGLGAFLAATTHAPLTAIFLLFEMTQSYAVAIPALITTILSLMIATRLEPESIDTLGLTAEGKSLHAPADRLVLERIPVATVYRREFDAIRENQPLPEILRLVRQSRSATFPVIGGADELVGVLSFAALRTLVLEEKLDPQLEARDLCDPQALTLTPADGLV